MKQKLASVDIGSYTARMLIAFKEFAPDKIIPISRIREYISIADYFEEPGIIKEYAIKKTTEVINRFALRAHQEKVEHIFAVGTGLIRRAINRNEFITQIEKSTGIRIIPISGKQEACLTAKGVIYSLEIKNDKNFAIVDIGGGSTEFFIRGDRQDIICSIPIGAAILHNKYIFSDPPKERELYKICAHVKGMLKEHISAYDNFDIIIGTGGTIAALAAVMEGILIQDISPQRINGKILGYNRIKNLLDKMKDMDLKERINILGLDKKRAKIIISGIIILITIMDFFSLEHIIVSLSDLLEGILLKPQILQEER